MSKPPALSISKVRDLESVSSGLGVAGTSTGVRSNIPLPLKNPKVPTLSSSSNPNLMTKAEQFFHFLKTMGYQAPSKLRPEHLEYAFKDEKSTSARLFTGLMRKIKGENALDPEEVEGYEKLKSEGLTMYGKDLEEAVDRRNSIEKQISSEEVKRSEERERLRQLIAQRQTEVLEIERRTDVITRMIKATEESKAHGQVIAARLLRESKDLDIEIQVSQKRLKDKTEALNDLKKALIMDEKALPSHMENAQSLVAVNWEGILQAEDDLINSVKPLILKHVAELIIRAEGYEDCKSDTRQADYVRGILSKHVENFERLKHCIIYERVKQAKLEIALAGEKVALRMLKPCLEQIKKVCMTGDVFVQIRKELDDSINHLEEVYEREYECAVESIRGGIHAELNTRFKTLSNIKSHAKKRLLSFFLSMYDILAPQKIRVDVLRNILKAEVNYYDVLVKKLSEHNELMYYSNMNTEFLGGDLDCRNLTQDGLALQAFFGQQDISPSTLLSVPSTWDALLKLHRNFGEINSSLVTKENVDFKQCLDDLSSQHQNIVEFYTKLKDKINSVERQRLQELENVQNEMEWKLRLMQENKAHAVEDSIAEKRRCLIEIKEALTDGFSSSN